MATASPSKGSVRTATTPTATSTASVATQSVAKRPNSTTLASRVSSPRLFAWLRRGLVVALVIAGVTGLSAIATSQSNQQQVAATVQHVHDLQDLRADVAQAQSIAMASFVATTPQQVDTQWQGYEQAGEAIAKSMVGAAVNTTDLAQMNQIVTDLTRWQTAVALAHGAGASPTTASATIQTVVDAQASLDSTLSGAIDSVGQTTVTSSALVVALVVAVATACLFLTALVIIARRTHRVINIGVAIGLIAAVAMVAPLAGYLKATTEADHSSTYRGQLSAIDVNVWSGRSMGALRILDPSRSADTVTAMTSDVVTAVGQTGMSGQVEAALQAFVAHQNQAATDSTPDLVLDATTWQDLSDQINSEISSVTTWAAAGVVPSLTPSILIVVGGLIGIGGTLAGVHARTKEYG
ncbi:MAG: hypothetical protein LBV06_04040 [Propionibacteriaceae bacterium]|jgi:hypothetical protein|nr:hypothetical protein [Propionibacteriaceae bacterium]